MLRDLRAGIRRRNESCRQSWMPCSRRDHKYRDRMVISNNKNAYALERAEKAGDAEM